jgi:hypothetical protein
MFPFNTPKRGRLHAVVASQGHHGEESGCKIIFQTLPV